MKVQVSAVFLVLSLIFLDAPCLSKIQNNPQKNIIFLLTDDQSCISLGCYHNPEVNTPNIDQLAADGMIFDRHYVTTAICMASRANIFTGCYEYRTGCNFTYGNLSEKLWQNSYPMILRKSGYQTAFAGKFGIEIQGRDNLPSGDFDKWGGGPGQTNYQTAKNKSMAQYAASHPHSTLSYAAFASDFIQQSVDAKKPFCLSISFKASHRPVTPDPKFDRIYAETEFSKPQNYGRENGIHLAQQSKTGRQFPRFEQWGYADKYVEVMRKYHQQIYAVDVAVGQIRDKLKKLNIDDSTVIIFTSDNGFMCGSHGYGSKVIPYEESTRVPLIIFDPTHTSSGKKLRCDSLTGSIDLAPTMLQLAGLNPPTNIDGVSLLNLLDKPTSTVRDSLSLMNFWGPDTTHSFGVVTNKWKYLFWYSQKDDMVATEELFNMKSDRNESHNAAGDEQHREQLNQMRQLYDDHLYDIKSNAINDDYRKFHQLFDRKKPWQAKQAILRKK